MRTGDYNSWIRQFHPIEWLAANTFSESRAAEVFGRLKHHNTRVTPMLTMHHVLDMPDLVGTDRPQAAAVDQSDRPDTHI